MNTSDILSKEILIKIFEKELTITPRYGMFQNDKHESLNEMIHALKNNLTIDDVYDLELEHETEMAVSSLFEYLDGDIEDLDDILYEDISNYEDIINGKSEESIPDIVVCKKQCNDCPFAKTSLRGFLADYTIEDFLSFQRADVAFPCHKMMKEDGLSVNECQKQIEQGKMKMCRGYVESIIKSAKMPTNPILKKAVEYVKEDGLSENSMSIFEFVEFHEINEKVK